MEVSHADLSEVTGVILVEIGAVVVLTTRHTATTGVLPVLAHSSMTGGDVAAAVREVSVCIAFRDWSFTRGRVAQWRLLHVCWILRDILFPRLGCSGRDCGGFGAAMLLSRVLRISERWWMEVRIVRAKFNAAI